MAGIGGVVIQFMADSKRAVSQIRNLGKSLEDMDDDAAKADTSLGKVATEIDQAGDKARASASDWQVAETGLDSVGDEADRTADRLRTAASDMASSIKTGARNVDTEADRMRTSLNETGRETGSEFIQNIGEGIGSGGANLNDVVSGTLGGLVNMIGTGGPLMTAAGVAALGIGSIFNSVKQQGEEIAERVQGLIDALEDLGEAGDAAIAEATWDEWLAQAKKSPEHLSKIVDGLDEMGISTNEWKEAMTGNDTIAADIRDKAEDIITKLTNQKITTGQLTDEEQKRLDGAYEVRTEIDKQNTVLEDTKDYQSDIERLTDDTAGKAKEWASHTADARTEAQRTKDIYDALDGKDVRIDFVANYTGKESDWNPAARGKSATPSVLGMAAAPVVVNVYAQGPDIPNSPRALINMLETHQTRMGRKPGTPRARAW